MTRRQSGSWLFGTSVVLATGVAFLAGARLRAGTPRESAPLKALGRTQVAENGRAIDGRTIGGAVHADESESQDFGGTFETVYALVKEQYVDKLPSDTKMARSTVRQMVGALEDPNSYFLDPDQRKLFEAESKGTLSGIGASLSITGTKKDGYTDYKIAVVAPLPGSPAEQAGLKPGDVITHVDGKWVLGYNPLITFNRALQKLQNREADEDEVEKVRLATRDRIAGGISLHAAELLLRGDKSVAKTISAKAKYTLTIQRKGSPTPLKVEVAPGTTTLPELSSKPLDGGATYIKLPFLRDGVEAEISKLLPSGNTGVVLDLRSNPGGSLATAQKVAGLFAPPGNLAVEIGARGRRSALETQGTPRYKGPITVLVDGGTGAAAEALAACLAERAGATLVGGKTFGDAQVQAIYSLNDGSGFTLSVGTLQSPKGVRWAGVGLTPQVALAAETPEPQVLAQAVAALAPKQVTNGGKG